MIYLRIYSLDAARHRRLIDTLRFGDWGSLGLWLANVATGDRRGFVYEIEERADAPGDADGE